MKPIWRIIKYGRKQKKKSDIMIKKDGAKQVNMVARSIPSSTRKTTRK